MHATCIQQKITHNPRENFVSLTLIKEHPQNNQITDVKMPIDYTKIIVKSEIHNN